MFEIIVLVFWGALVGVLSFLFLSIALGVDLFNNRKK